MTPLGWALLLLALGFVFLVLEFIVPSGGLLAVLCSLSLLAAIVLGFAAGLGSGLAILLTVCVLVPLGIAAALRWWPATPIGRRILIQRPRSADEVLPETPAYRELKELIGRRGRSKGLMLPSGLVVIDGKTYDAVSEGVPIEPNQPVVVVNISTQRLVVRPDAGSPSSSPASGPSADPLRREVPDPFAE
jgi:membrane-bound serine protease (ClpP class)